MLRVLASRSWSAPLAIAAALLIVLASACGGESPTATERPESPASPAATPAATSAPSPVNTQAPAPTSAPAEDTPTEGHQPTVSPSDPEAGTAQPSPTTPLDDGGPETGETDAGVTAYEPDRSGEELTVILATTVLEPGQQRVAFLLTTQSGLVKDSMVEFTPVYLPDNAPGDEIATSFNEWPYGTRGTFAAEANFDRPGTWRLDISAAGPDATGWAAVEVEVVGESPVPALGSIGPLSENKTLSAYGDIALVTTDYSPDSELYEVTIRDAVEGPLPAVIVFASPAFCTTATCGPQVDTVSELRAKYDGQANFIHVEIYDNPDEIQGDLTRARIAPTVDEWGLTQLPDYLNESWTFVLDSEGRVLDRFEGFATLTELEESLQGALN